MADPTPPTVVAEPRFTNVARIRHTPSEFYVDFAQLSLDYAGMANLIASLVMTPQHAKALLRILEDNIGKFEAQHGAIQEPPAEVLKPIK